MIETVKEVQLGKYAKGFGLFGVLLAFIAFGIGLSSGSTAEFMHSYLFAFLMFMSLTFGCFALTLLQHTLQAKWALPVLRIFESGGGLRNFILMALLFIPLAVGMKYLYPWSNPEIVAADKVLQHRQPYLNPGFWLVRAAIYFLVCGCYARFMRQSTKRQEVTGKFTEQQTRANWAAPGLVFVVLAVTFAYTDWVMSVDPHWYSTMYGVWFAVGMGLGGLALATLILCLNANKDPYRQVANKGQTRDLGNLLLAFTMLWGYTNLSQFLIIWNGNLPEFTTYYVNRSLGHWNILGGTLVIGHFFIPFFALLSPSVKATPRKLAMVAGWILLMRLLDHFYTVKPFFQPSIGITLTDVLTFAAVGCLWAAVFSWNIGRLPLFTTYDPRILETPEHAH